jgi:hypothetical protein
MSWTKKRRDPRYDEHHEDDQMKELPVLAILAIVVLSFVCLAAAWALLR